MKIRKLLQSALKSIMRNRMRSFLTMLGIIIGVSAVIIMVAVGKGAQVEIERQIAALGSNLFVIFPHAISFRGVNLGSSSAKPFSLDDYEKISREAIFVDDITPVIQAPGHCIAGNINWFTQMQGVAPNYIKIRDWELESGAFFTDSDVKSRAKVVVLGKTVADNLFPEQEAVGSMMRIRNTPFKVIGVLKAKGQSTTGSDQDDIAVAPYTTVLYRMRGFHNVPQHIDLFMASAIAPNRMQEAQDELRAIMRESHKLNPGDEDDFTIRNQTEITDTASQASKTLTMLLGSIAGVSLIVGGIGIMNIMLVSVTERTKEIGLRMSVGARSGDILTQFLIEAMTLSLLGGIIGIGLSFLTGYLLNIYSTFKVIIQPQIILLAFVFAGAVGVFFGFYPARKASRLNPIEALRYE
jgi:putative ABC transport system permease protein